MDVLLFVVSLLATISLVPLEALGNDCGPLSKLGKSYIDPSTNDQANIIEEMYGVTENDCYAACCDAVQTGNCNVVVFNRHSSSCVLMSCVPTDSCAVSDSNNHTVTFIGDPSVSTTTPASGSDSATTQASTSDTSTKLSNSAVLSHEIQQPAIDSVMETTTMSPLETALNAPDVEKSTTENSTTTAMIGTSTQALKPLPKITEAFSFSESLSVSSNGSSENIVSNLKSTTSVKPASVEASNTTNNYSLENGHKLNTTTNVDIVVSTVTTASSSSSLSSTSQSASTGVNMSKSANKSSSTYKLAMDEMSNSSTTLSPNTTQTLREEKQTTASTVEASPKMSSLTRSPLSSTLMSSARKTNQTRVSSTSSSTTSDASSIVTPMKVVFETFSNASTEASTSNNTSTSSSSSSTKSSPSSIRSTTESPLHLPEIPTTTTSPNTTAQAQASGVGDNDEFQPMSAGLIAALSVGIIFFFAVMVLMGKRLFDSWHRRHYNRMDYLINGMYN